MATKHNLDLGIINDGYTYAKRCALALQAIAGMQNYYDTLRSEIVLPAVHAGRKCGERYTLQDIKMITLSIMDYDKNHAIEGIRSDYKAAPTIQASGRKWFDKVNGNTYHSVTLCIAGHKVYIPMQYGYGNQWKQSAFEWLESNGFIPVQRHANGFINRDYSLINFDECVNVNKADL